MAVLWLRAITPRGRRVYLAAATALCLASATLLILRSWGARLPLRTLDLTEEGYQSSSQYLEASYLRYSKQEWEQRINRESAKRITWFVQVSDLHLHTGAAEEVQHFQEFVDDAITLLKPSAVVVTGDLTNSKSFGVKLAQLPQEWSLYKRSVRDRLVLHNTTQWLDLPGNHDNFDEVQHAHFRAYAVQTGLGIPGRRLGTVVPGSEGRNITLLPVDASLMPGLRAFNFLGYLPEEEYLRLQEAAIKARAKGDVVVFYGHYPSNTIISPRDVMKLLSLGVVYICGHLHTGYGLLDPLWARHPTGLLEVELADWSHNHRYRILSVDNGLVNWVDVAHPSWPVVMVARVQRYTKGQGAFRYMLRLLVFSNEEVLAVSVRVDDNLGHWITCEHRYGPLYTATVDLQLEAWDPQISEKDFVKTLQVLVGNASGSKSLLRVGMDGAGFERPLPSLLAASVLSINFHDMFLLLYVLGIGSCCLLLLSCCVLLVLVRRQARCVQMLPKRFIAVAASLSHKQTVFFLLLVFLLYPAVGPWYIGPLARDVFGAVFMWGIFVESSTLPGQLTYPDAYFLWITLQLPVFGIIFLKKLLSYESTRHWCGRWLAGGMVFTVALQVPAVLAWLILDSILLNGPLRLLLTLLALVLWRL
ncbi:transmembrane protein 62-like [Eriocheir sinensis]|uniref:transmembrane protein 62-like n=1 Tax=Eriocheir sinensis TaxID=95602 RepID=UPI0021CA0AAF|nr:transmembrane protein 62-like [Eriocheir sinensis]